MKLSTKGRYGLRAMADLAVYSQDGPVSVQSIASRQELSEKYLEQLFALLKKAELVTSTRGTLGGYKLARDMELISVGDVLRALEGDLTLVDCNGFEGGCGISDACVSKYVWKRMEESLQSTVDSISLKELVEQSCAQPDPAFMQAESTADEQR